MSPCIGAGSKNGENQFSGVLMGKIGTSTNDTNPVHGLYGFSDGAQAFGFKEDGTAFIGKSGAGRINFNGTNGTITSFGYGDAGLEYKNTEGETIELGSTGLKIDLDDPSLNMDYDGKSLIEFVPKKNIMKLSSSGDGMTIDLNSGFITSNKFKLLSISNNGDAARKLCLSTEDNNGFFMGYTSTQNYIFDLPSVKMGYDGVMSANSIQSGALSIKNSTLNYSGSTGMTDSSFLDLNYIRYEANMITIKVSKDNSNEYYDIYLNTIVPLFYEKDTTKEYVNCIHFLDIRPNFELGVNNLDYLNTFNSYQLYLPLSSNKYNPKLVMNGGVGPKFKVIPSTDTTDNIYLKSKDIHRSIAGELEGISSLVKYYSLSNDVGTVSLYSRNAGPSYLIDIDTKNAQIKLDVY
jgi:hypothetical protein